MTTISYKLPDFEGPLDLLLYLIRKNKLNICDIPIRELLEQYIHTIEQMQQADLEVETSFLEMAARLVHMKSAFLLPRQEEAEQLRKELEGELIEYQLCQQAAQRLGKQHVGFDIYVRTPAPYQPDKTYRIKHQPEELYAAYLAAAGRGRRRLPPPVQAYSIASGTGAYGESALGKKVGSACSMAFKCCCNCSVYTMTIGPLVSWNTARVSPRYTRRVPQGRVLPWAPSISRSSAPPLSIALRNRRSGACLPQTASSNRPADNARFPAPPRSVPVAPLLFQMSIRSPYRYASLFVFVISVT
jgi:hypothetical protein